LSHQPDIAPQHRRQARPYALAGQRAIKTGVHPEPTQHTPAAPQLSFARWRRKSPQNQRFRKKFRVFEKFFALSFCEN
jgi:hypothetical protein